MFSSRVALWVAVAAAWAGCVETEGEEAGRTREAVSVTWQNPIRVTASGNSLTKVGGGGKWNAGASSVETIGGDGYVQFTSAENTTAKMAGLSSDDAAVGYADIDFAIYLKANGGVAVYEAGVLRGSFGTYAAGDLFRVAVEDGVVRYLRNGVIFYTSAVAPSSPLLVDTSLFTDGATLSDVSLVSTSVSWQNAVGVSIADGVLTKTGASGWNAGAATVEALAGDGFVEFTTGENTTAKMAGLSSGDSGQDYADIDYAVYLKANGVFGVYEAGVLRNGNLGTYAAGDTFRIEVRDGAVLYSKNGGAPFYTSLVAPTFPLLVDTSFNTPGGTIRDVVLTEAADVCPVYAGGGPVCVGTFTVQNSLDLSAIAGCAEITGNLTIDAPGMPEVALPALERVGGYLRVTQYTVDLIRLRLPQLKEVGSNTDLYLPAGAEFDLSRVRAAGARFAIQGAPPNRSSLPCLEAVGGDFTAARGNGTAATIDVPRLRSVTGGVYISGVVPALETAGSIAGPDITAPVLTELTGGIGATNFTAPVLTTVGGDVSSHPIDAPSLTHIGGTVSFWNDTGIPAVRRVGALTVKGTANVALPDLVEITRTLAAGIDTNGNCLYGAAPAYSLDLPSLLRAGAILLCTAPDVLSMPALRKVTGPRASERMGLKIGDYPADPTGTLQVDLPALTSITGNVEMRRPSNLASLLLVTGRLEIWAPMSAPLLDEVRGVNAHVKLFAPLSADALRIIGGGLEIHSGAGAVSLPGLTSADYVLAWLSDFSSLDLPSLTTLPGTSSIKWHGRIRVNRTTATRVAMPALTSIPGDFEMWDNDALTSIDFSSLTSVGDLFRLSENDVLPACYGDEVYAQLLAAGWSGTASVGDNNGTGTCP